MILRVVEEDAVACEDPVDLAVAEMWERTTSRRQRDRAQSFNLGDLAVVANSVVVVAVVALFGRESSRR